MILYPLHQFCSESFNFKDLNIETIVSNDLARWSNINVDYSSAHGFNPSDGNCNNTSLIPSKFEHPPNWLIYKTSGTIDGSIKKMEAIIRELFVCAYAFKVNSPNDLLEISDKMFPSYCIVFPKDSDKIGCGVRKEPMEYLQPSFAVKVRIDVETLSKIAGYFVSIAKMNIQYQQRFKIATQFVHYGMMSNTYIERYINLYIALDALFGTKGNVGKSIKEGILKTNTNEYKIAEKSSMLYDLRNEILHGGCSSLYEWKYYDKYIEKYDIDPYTDIELICYRSIKNYYNYVMGKINSSDTESKALKIYLGNKLIRWFLKK